MIGGCDALGLSLVAGNEQSVKDDLKWILNYSREFLKKRFTFFIIQHHKESYERYQKVKSLIEDNGDKQSNLEVLIPESLFFVRRITECFDRLSSESLALDPERPGVRPLGAEGYPLESGEMTRRLRTYEASLNRLESIYIEQKAMEEFIGMVSDIPPSMSSAEAILKSETLIVDTRNIFESRQEALVYLEKELQSLLEHLHTTYHKLVSACLDALEAYLEHNELISEYEKLVTVLDAMEDPEIGRLLSKLDSYEKLIEEFKIRSSNFESSMEIKRGMITEVRLNLDKSKREHQKKKRALENAKRVCENFDPKIPKLITWYQEQLDFIKPIQDVVKVEKISESAFYIKYSIFGNTYKLEVGCLDNPDVLCNTTFSKLKLTPDYIDLTEIARITGGDFFKTKKSLISYVVSIVPHKIKISLLRDAEVLAIKESLGRVVSCSVSRDRCIIDSPQRQQKIIISLESGYPAIPGPRGLRVVACYPYFKPYSDEDTTRAVATWQELITSKNIKSLSEFIEKCINADLARLNI